MTLSKGKHMEQTLTLRLLEDSDLPLVRRWLYLPHVAPWFENPLDWLFEIEHRNQEFSWLCHFIAEADEKPIGLCQYYPYENSGETWHGRVPVEGTYSIDYLIGETDYLGRGFGKRIVEQLIRCIWERKDAKRIIVQPEKENQASRRTLLSCGFRFDEESKLFILNHPGETGK